MSAVFALIDRLAPHVERELNLHLKSNQEAESLSSKLKKIHNGLADAEKEGATDAHVRDLLKEIEDVAFEMEDALDEWQIANLKVQLEGSEDIPSGPCEMIRSYVRSLYRCFTHVVDRREITKKIKLLSDKIDEILTNGRDRYDFNSNRRTDPSNEVQPYESASYVPTWGVYGRDLEKNNLIEKLVPGGETNDNEIQIISLIGMGGVGKTTLAQIAYNNPTVRENFELKAWVSVPNPFRTFTIAGRILEAFAEHTSNNAKSLERGNSALQASVSVPSNAQALETLLGRVKSAVAGKKFLLVLDNVWEVVRSKWDPLKASLRGAPGSRILVTTRNELAANSVGATQWQSLNLLSDDDCGKIVNGIALNGKSSEECAQLRNLGIEIAKKCNGLPLAARCVGSMLALRSTEQEWRDVLENPLWTYEDGEEMDDLYRLLKLSYLDLSPRLKRCFLSCILFPKGYSIDVYELIRIWMAYGYLSSHDVKSEGLMCFNSLAKRSFFQRWVSKKDMFEAGTLEFRIHDIMYDFAVYLSKNEYGFIKDGGLERSSPSQRGQLTWNSIGRIRTFCVSDVSWKELSQRNLESVRILRMSRCSLEMFPQEVGKLIHLRYLNLSKNPMEELPEIVCDMYNLETLILDDCDKLRKLPEGMGKLIHLRHLLNGGTNMLWQYPQGLKKLTGLWTLTEFRAKKTSELGILGNLNQLCGSMDIYLPSLSDDIEEFRKANLENKIHLQALKLLFHVDVEQTDNIVDALQPPPELQSLVIAGDLKKQMSHWIENGSFNNLRELGLLWSRDCPEFFSLGKLPMLEYLFIARNGGLKGLTTEGVKEEEKGASAASWFPALKTLHFHDCEKCEEWEDIREGANVSIMPSLQSSYISECPSVHVLPHNLLQRINSLEVLLIASSKNLEEGYQKNKKGSDWDQISHIKYVVFQ